MEGTEEEQRTDDGRNAKCNLPANPSGPCPPANATRVKFEEAERTAAAVAGSGTSPHDQPVATARYADSRTVANQHYEALRGHAQATELYPREPHNLLQGGGASGTNAAGNFREPRRRTRMNPNQR